MSRADFRDARLRARDREHAGPTPAYYERAEEEWHRKGNAL